MAQTGYIFTPYVAPEQAPFDKLFDIFSELITHTSGDVEEALDWLKILDKEYNLTTPEYTLEDFIEDLKKRGYLREEIKPDGKGDLKITAKTERAIRKNAMAPRKPAKAMKPQASSEIFNLAMRWSTSP